MLMSLVSTYCRGEQGISLTTLRSDIVERKVSSNTKHLHPSGMLQVRTCKGSRITLSIVEL